MDEKLTQYNIRSILDSAEKMTGNINFMHIRQELIRLWELEEMAKIVCEPFPTKFVENYPYSKSESLEVQIKKRMENTIKFLGLLNQSLNRG